MTELEGSQLKPPAELTGWERGSAVHFLVNKVMEVPVFSVEQEEKRNLVWLLPVLFPDPLCLALGVNMGGKGYQAQGIRWSRQLGVFPVYQEVSLFPFGD